MGQSRERKDAFLTVALADALVLMLCHRLVRYMIGAKSNYFCLVSNVPDVTGNLNAAICSCALLCFH